MDGDGLDILEHDQEQDYAEARDLATSKNDDCDDKNYPPEQEAIDDDKRHERKGKKMEKKLAVREPVQLEAVAPDQVVMAGMIASKELQKIVEGKKKKVIFNGEQYLEFEDWQTLGKFYGVSVKTGEAKFIDIAGTTGAYAKAEVLNKDGVVVGGAEAYCLKDEPNWAKKPFFQLASMAQTRAGSKALRNVMSWVAVLAGYKGTPAEEMEGVMNGFDHKPVYNTAPATNLPPIGASSLPPCPKCGVPMAIKTRKDGRSFYGCTQWRETGCKGSANIPSANDHLAKNTPAKLKLEEEPPLPEFNLDEPGATG